jgi:ATP-dependent helicase HepA
MGFGFCRERRPDGALVVYTDIPGVAEQRSVVAFEDLLLSRVPRGARVWVKGQPYGWHAAEITGWAGSGEYNVRVAGMSHDVQLTDDRFIIRWDRPLTDPVGALAWGFCDSPAYYEARRDFLDQLVHQRRQSRGFTAALSSPVELYQHQLDTVARVLSDPVLRYLLADEVGLGKTVEAGLILRQLLLDDAEATALIAVPAVLVQQWEEELRDRLLLDEALDARRLRLVSHEDLAGEGGLGKHAVLVMDEAHRLLPELARRPTLRADLVRARGLLLLSATPMRGDLSTFLGLLNLLDPVAFPLDDLDSFGRRVRQREREASSLQVLSNRRASLRQRGDVLRDVLALHGSDPAVARLVAQCQATDDLAAPAWSALGSYVRETYRISRRMIRHRRDTDLTAEYPITGRRVTFVPVTDPARPVVDEFLERYRDQLAGRPARSYSLAVLPGLGGPRALLWHLERRLATPPGRPHEVPPADRALLQATVARLRLAETGTRRTRVFKVVQERLDRDLKVVVVGTSTDLAREFLDEAKLRWPSRVGGHLYGTRQADREEDVATFLDTTGGRVLVGDHTLEEGRNLQAAHVLVNLDLPLDPNRLEQRIGRLDRFGRRAEPAEVVVFAEPDSDWVSAHIDLLAKGIGIFDASVATVQRKLAEVLTQVIAALPSQGCGAFALDLPALRSGLDDERDEVDLLEELESATVAADFDDAGATDLRAAEQDVERLRASFVHLTSMQGGVGLYPQEDPVKRLLRFGAEKAEHIHGLSDDAAREVLPLLQRPRAYARDVATSRRGVAPLRLGDPLVEWLENHLRADERGRARAVVRPYRGVAAPTLWLSCDFLVEFDDAHLRAESEGIRRRLRRRGDALLPPSVIRTWTDAAGPAAAILIREVLELPFDEDTDHVLRGPLWRDVLTALPDWRQRCQLSGEAALEQVQTMPALTSEPVAASTRAQAEVAARVAVLEARSQRLPSAAERAGALQELEREQMLGRALVHGVEQPAVSTVACGAAVLWPAS